VRSHVEGVIDLATYEDVYRQSIEDPERFWAGAGDAVEWIRRWDRVLDPSVPQFYRWFPGGVLNTCDNVLDRQIREGRGDQIALIYDSPVTRTIRKYSFEALTREVARCAGGLSSLGVVKGDRVVIYMPMVPEAVIAMLACARLGAIHSVVFGGFAARELASRLADATPKVIISASCGIEINRVIPYKPLLDQAIDLAKISPRACAILQRPELEASLTEGRDIGWDTLMNAEPVGCVPCMATDPLYILYTSGTTGVPKGVVRDHGGHLVALVWSMKNIYAMKPGDTFWAASDIGWVVGHSYIVYAPLAYGCTSILYEGKSVGTPDPGAFWRVASDHGVNALFTAPTAIRAIKREDPNGVYRENYDLSCLRMLFLAGERCDPDTLGWAGQMLKIPVIDHWWQTESGWPMAANPAGIELLQVKPGSCTRPVPGYDIRVLDDQGGELPPGSSGNVMVKLPLPPGCLTTLWQNDAGFLGTYLSRNPGYYLTGDAGFIDPDGYLWIMGRTDDIINTAGHRLSTGSMEGVISSHPDVAECAVTGVNDPVKGEVPLGFVVLKSGVTTDSGRIERELISMVREKIGPIASFKRAVVVPRLPKTRSGKILRRTLKSIADGEEFRIPSTIEDPSVLEEIAKVLKREGYPRAA